MRKSVIRSDNAFFIRRLVNTKTRCYLELSEDNHDEAFTLR
ncbi:MAG: hypothetical protein ACOCW1_03475 [Chitinispirillaceae bacterium]